MNMMSNSFFQDPGNATDKSYCNAKSNPETRRFTEELWQEFSDYALDEPNFLSNAKAHFHAAFWEMYLGVALHRSGLYPQRKGCEGPDFLVCTNGQRIWFEAVAPKAGDGNDGVPPIIPLSEGGGFQRVPTDQMILRITNAVSKKQRQFQKAINDEIAEASDGLVIAINGHGIRNMPEFNPCELLLESFLGYGGERCSFAKDADGNIDVQSEPFYRTEILKKSEASVPTTGFLSDEAASVSAVLYSDSHVGDARREPRPTLGADFIILHNPRAAIPISKELILNARNECWIDEDGYLRCLKEG